MCVCGGGVRAETGGGGDGRWVTGAGQKGVEEKLTSTFFH